jgi:hypothetical protein
LPGIAAAGTSADGATARSTVFAADTTPPVTTAIGVPVGWQSSYLWVITFETDEVVDTPLTYVSLDGGPYVQTWYVNVFGDGVHTISYYSVDTAGNVESPKSAVVLIDTTAPSITVSGIIHPKGWTRVPPTVTLTASDAGSQVAFTQYREKGAQDWITYTAPFTVTIEGRSEWECRSVDMVGNVGSPYQFLVSLDTCAPSVAVLPADVKSGRRVPLRYQINDPWPSCGEAKVAVAIYQGGKLRRTVRLKPGRNVTNVPVTYNWKCTLPAGRYTIKATSTDDAGNVQSKVGSARLTVR